MESAATKRAQREAERARVQKQMVALQAKLSALNDEVEPGPSTRTAPLSPKRRRADDVVLAPSSPSPKRRRITPKDDFSAMVIVKPAATPPGVRNTKARQSNSSPSELIPLSAIPRPSQLLSKLSEAKTKPAENSEPIDQSSRTDSFSSKPKTREKETEAGTTQALLRDERLAIIADLLPGPYDHKAPEDDRNFQKLEPHSGIYLSKRELPHGDFCEYMSCRYYISPSMLYSVIRLLPNNEGYDVPVIGDWVTIAVVAERGPIRVSRGPTTTTSNEGNDGGDEEERAGPSPPSQANPGREGKRKKQEPPSKPTGRKYVNLKLIDFGARSRGSDVGGKAVIRGDAFLSLLLFESDSKEKVPREGGGLPETVYKGGSKGAFERMATMPEGAVIALLNPRVLKPFNRSTDKPHPTSNILALTPESIKSVAVIGFARDLGRCEVRKKDGKVCGSWYDKRVSAVCEYHVQNAVERRRNARAEFTAGTSAMGTSAAKKKQPEFDPRRKWGLQPDSGTQSIPTDSGGATYVVSGHIVDNKQHLFLGESIGREAQARAKRAGKKDDDRQLQSLLERDREGMQHVELARKHAEQLRKAEVGVARGKKSSKGSSKASQVAPADAITEAIDGNNQPARTTYSAEVIKQLGFDPTLKLGQKASEDGSSLHARLDRLASERASKAIVLGPRPGPKHKTSVRAPQVHKHIMQELGAHDEDLCISSEQLVDLDSSDSELIVDSQST